MAKNSIWIFAGQGLSLIAQAVYFIVIARLLGTFQYGLFVGAAASVSIVSQYSSLGSGLLFLRHVSPDHSRFPQYWGNILLSTLSLGTILVLLLTAISPWFLHGIAMRIVVLLAIGECICGQLTLAMSQIFQAFEKMRYTAVLSLLTTCTRMLLAVGMLLIFHHANATQWVVASLSVSTAATIGGAILVTKHFGLPEFHPRLFLQRAGEGFVFAISGSTASVYNDVDKALLAHMGMNAANGIYTMAYRVIDIGTIPIRSIHAAAFPRFFRHGAGSEGLYATEQFARKLLRKTSMIGLAAAAVMFLAAPVIPHLVGNGFASSVIALRWLCPIPFFRSFQLSAADALAGAGKQSWRLAGQMIAAGTNVAMNLYLIPRYSWVGAAWASLATDALLGITLWSILTLIKHRRQTTTTDSEILGLQIVEAKG
jgi:O-antigen/teichoic acid export membrane protein